LIIVFVVFYYKDYGAMHLSLCLFWIATNIIALCAFVFVNRCVSTANICSN